MKKPIPFGKYLLLERINVGGMAEVFLGKAFGVEGFERLLAIKRILPTMVEDTEFITMFLDEARISVQLNHANVVQIYELGKHDDSYYIAMEYVSGKDLRHLLEHYRKRKEVMPTAQAVFIASKICEGLEYAHRKKDARGQDLHIVHRDVSPQNILLSYEGETKIIDFGIAKAANRAQKTQAGILKGKFGYMSPEQVRGLPIDHRSDLFAVGVILYEMLTGERLFVGESDFSTLEKVRNAEVLPPRQYNSNIPVGLEKVILKSLARDVEDRYQWCSDMQEDLMRYLLSGDSIYSSKQMATFMRQAFADDLAREQGRLEQYASVERPDQVEVSGITASSAPAPRSHPAPAPEPAPARRPVRPTPAPQPEPPPEDEPDDGQATMLGMEGLEGDPYNPVIPPPEPGELDDQPPADRTEIFKPAFNETKASSRKPARPARALADAEESTMTPVSPGRDAKRPGRPSMRAPVVAEPPPPEEPEATPEEGENPAGANKTMIGASAPTRANGARPAPRRGAAARAPEPEEPSEDSSEEADPERSIEDDEVPDDGPSTMPPDSLDLDGAEGDTGADGEEPSDEAPEEDANATVLRPTPVRRQTSQRAVPRQTSTKQPVARPPTLTKQPVSKAPPPKVTGTKQPAVKPTAASGKAGSKLPLIIAVAGAAVLLLIVAAAVFLRPASTGLLMVSVVGPKEARIRLDGKTPIKAEEPIVVPVGKHTVTVDAEGYHRASETIEVRPNAKIPLDIELEPEQPEPADKPDEGDGAEPTDSPDQPGDVANADPGEPKKPADADPKPEDPKPSDPKPEVATDTPKPADPKPADPKPADPKPEAKPTTFALKVESVPSGADVEINGKKLGKTPHVVKSVDATKVKAVVVSLKGYKSENLVVAWDGEQKEMGLVAALEKLPEPEPKKPDPKPVVKTEPKKVDPPKPKVADRPKVSKGQGKLVTISKPVARVLIDGVDTNRWTPIPPAQPLELSAGEHTITYVAGDGRKATRKVTIPVNDTAKVIGVSDFQ